MFGRHLVQSRLLQNPPRNDRNKTHQPAAPAALLSEGQACIHQLLADPSVDSLLFLPH